MRSPEEGIEDLKSIKALGLRGVMMPGVPAMEDYDSPIYDKFWEAAIELELLTAEQFDEWVVAEDMTHP